MGFTKVNLTDFVNDTNRQSTGRCVSMAIKLSIPAMIAQLSAIIMEYIDAAMVGSLGANASASIGLVATTTWLFFGLCSAVAAGFSVQVAHYIGARRYEEARQLVRESLSATLLFSMILMAIGILLSDSLPAMLGGNSDINPGATSYFFIFALSMPAWQLYVTSAGLLRAGGNMTVPGLMGALMCLLDVLFNFFFIFPTRQVGILGIDVTIPGAGMGVTGAAIGSALAELTIGVIVARYLIFSSRELKITGTHGSFIPQIKTLTKAFRIGFPMGLERFITSAAQIMLTIIVAPLGTFAIAANAFAITAESICYMPGYGIADAATTLVGQSLGAGNRALARRMAYVTIGMGMAIMTFLGIIMYMAAPVMIGVMTPVNEILELGVSALRIEAFAEPMFAAAIVAYGVFVGAGDTVLPCSFNLGCMWVIRITLAAILAPRMGLDGVWLAMAIELSCRGLLFLWRLRGDRWLNNSKKITL